MKGVEIMVGKEKSKCIFDMKGIAIFSVICAHMADLPESAAAVNVVCANIVKSFGCLGVPVFLVLSGYLFVQSAQRPFLQFWKKKVLSLFLPWLLWASVLYVYVSVRHGGFGVWEWLKFIIGVDTPFYYLTSLCICYLVYFTLKRNAAFISATAALSICMNLATALFYDELSVYINPFLNPLNWMVYFAAGMLIAQKWNINVIGRNLYAKRYILLGLSVLLFTASILQGGYLAYWKVYSMPVFAVFFLTAAAFASRMEGKRGFWTTAGEYSFAIYLLHSPAASVCVNLKNRIDFWPLTLLAPVAVFVIMVVFVFAAVRISEKLSIDKYVKPLIGIR